MTATIQQLGPVETRIATTIATEAFKDGVLPYVMMRVYGFSALKDKALYAAILGAHRSMVNPPPSPARQRAMNAQLEKNADL